MIGTIFQDCYSFGITIEIELGYNDVSHLGEHAEEVSGLDEIGFTIVSVSYYSRV